MRQSLLLIAVGCLVNLSCQRFHKKFETIAMRCGVEPSQVDRNRIALALVTERGETPSALALANLSIRFVDSENKAEALAASPMGCIFIRAEDGIVQAQNPDAGLHLSVPVKGNNLSNLDEIILKKKSLVDFQLLCPKEGLYSNGVLPLPLNIKGQGSLESLAIQLRADSHVLLQKPYGEASWELPSQLSLSTLPAGTYRLKMSYQSSMDAWDVPAPALADCPLSIQTEAPSIQGLQFARTKMEKPYPIKKGELLNWYADSPIRAELRSCREDLAADEDALDVTTLECVPKAQCLDEKNFELHEQKRADATGLFHYFVYAEDRAGNRSPLQCERVVVSAAAPRIDLSWKNPKWNVPLSVMEEAVLDMEAVAAVTHPEISDAGLLRDLECKVDFRINGTMMLPGRDVLCTNESCQALTLDQYQTCGPNIRFTLGRFWGEQKAQRMEMRLHVRSSDGAGQWQEATRSLWIYPERFKPLAMPMPADRGTEIKEARDGTIFLANNRELFKWNESLKNWERVALTMPTELRAFDLHQDGHGDLYAVWRTNESLGILQLNDKVWDPVADHPILASCHPEFQVHPESGFFCQKETEPAMLWRNKQWQILDLPDSCDVFEFFSSDMVTCKGSAIYQKIEGAWRAVPDAPTGVRQTIRDSKNRPWVLGVAEKDSALTDSLSYFEDGRWNKIETRPKRRAQRYGSKIYADPSGGVYYNDAAYVEANNSWQIPQDLEMAFPRIVARLKQDHLKRTWFLTDHGMGLYTAKGLRFYPLAAFGIAAVDDYLLDSKDRLWIFTGVTDDAKSILRFDPVNWHSYREEAGIKAGEANSRIWPLWLNQEGLPEFLFSYGGVMQGTANHGWKRIVPDTTADDTVLQTVVLNGQGERLGHDYKNIFVINEGSSEKISSFSPGATLYHHSYPDKKGRLWFYHMGTRNYWLLDGRNLIHAPLPENFKIGDGVRMYVLPERTLVTYAGKFLSWNEGTAQWDERTWMEERLPDRGHIFEQIGPDHVLIQMSNGSPLRLQTRSARDIQIIPKPPVSTSNGRFRQTNSGLLFISFRDAIYLYHKDKWIKLISVTDIAQRLDSLQPVEIQNAELDSWQRLWVTGTNFKLLRLDLRLEDLEAR